MFKANPRPERKEIDFSTNSLSVNNKYAWVSINRQTKFMATSRVRLAADSDGNVIRGTTENVEALTLDLKTALPGSSARKVEIDGQTIEVGKVPGAFFFRDGDGKWSYATQIQEGGKWSAYAGPFKNIFNHRVVFVYGTKGTTEENTWMKSKARFDAETLWYRGNGAVDVVSDVEFAKGKFQGRNTLLFGNSETNGAWLKLLANCPIKVGRAGILVGTKAYSGDRATCFIYPSSQERTLVGAVGGTTLNGLRLTDRLPYFTSGVQFPDFSVFDAEVFDEGSAKVLDAGYFDNNWRIGERVSN